MANLHSFAPETARAIVLRCASVLALLYVEGWNDFFKKYPDYKNNLTCVTVQQGVVVMVGSSTCSNKTLAGPNIWIAKVSGEKVSEWSVHWLNKR